MSNQTKREIPLLGADAARSAELKRVIEAWARTYPTLPIGTSVSFTNNETTRRGIKP